MSKTYILAVDDYGGFDPTQINCAASSNKELIENLKDTLNEFFANLPADKSKDIRANVFLNDLTYRAQLIEAVRKVVVVPESAEEFVALLCELCDIGSIFVYADNFSVLETVAL